MSASFDAGEKIFADLAEVEKKMSDPAVLSDQVQARKVGRRYSELKRQAESIRSWQKLSDDLDAAKELAEVDSEFAKEAERLESEVSAAHQKMLSVLAPRDPEDASDVLMEIKAGAGGEESALFAGDLLRMYQRYSEKRGWSFKVMDMNETDLGGVKDAQISIRAKGNPSPEEGVWASMKYEGGVHRVQRVPVTETQGRIHTSAAGVYVMPEVEDEGEVEIVPNDIRVDVFRSSGPGGQSVNTTDSAVRITHLPTGIVVSMQNEKSQIQNREAAMRVLRSRLAEEERRKREAEEAEARHSQVRTVDRSERIRTYNFPENRIADHRTGYKAFNLDIVLGGELQPVIDSAIKLDEEHQLAKATGQE